MLMNAHSGDDGSVPAPGEEPASIAASINAALAALRRRWKLLAAIVLGVFGASAAYIFHLPSSYSAVARVQINPSARTAMGDVDNAVTMADMQVVDTEVSKMRSLDIARDVVKRLGLVNAPWLSAGLPALPAHPSASELETRGNTLAGRLLNGLSVQREKSTMVVDVQYTSSDGERAATLANAFANRYIDSSVGRRTGSAAKQADFINKQLQQLGSVAEATDDQLARYRAATGIVKGGSATVTDQQITPLASQLATAESEAAAAAAEVGVARRQIATGGIDAVSAVLGSDVISSLRGQRAQLVIKQGEVLTRYGPRHPQSIQIQQQLNDIDAQIAAEANRVIGGLESKASAANARAASLRGDLVGLRGRQAADTRASAGAESLERRADAVHQSYNRLAEQAQQTNAMASSSIAQAQIVEEATAPDYPTSPKRRLLLAAAGIFALALGIGVVSAIELMAKGFRTVRDVERLGIPVLATVPRLSGKQLLDDDGKPMAVPETITRRPMSSYAEAHRSVRRSLTAQGIGASPKVIAIASSLPEEGKTSYSLSLARISAMAGDRTLVIDTDLRRAQLRRMAAIEPREAGGLIEVLRDGIDPVSVICRDEVDKLDILPVASPTFLPEDLFSGPAMHQLLVDMRTRYDTIIVDTAPLLGVADARTVAALADALVLVIKWDATPVSAVKSAVNLLRNDAVPLTGAVMTMVDVGAEAYGALYYSKKYANYYQSQ